MERSMSKLLINLRYLLLGLGLAVSSQAMNIPDQAQAQAQAQAQGQAVLELQKILEKQLRLLEQMVEDTSKLKDDCAGLYQQFKDGKNQDWITY
jgi:hypothetical protein